MKKRFLLVTLAFVCAFALVACGGGSEDIAVADESGGDDLSYDASYLSWDGEDWDAASDDERYECARAAIIAAAEAVGADINAPDDAAIAQTSGGMDNFFAPDPSLTVQNYIDTTAAAVDAVQEEE
jgi:hypothetical protein